MKPAVVENADRLGIVQWLKKNSLPLNTVNSQGNISDLLPFREIIGPAKLVGLGEATHGNKEFAQIKDRMLRFLIEEMEFDGIIVEVSEEPARNIDKYIKTGKGNPRKLLSELGYWITRTQEVLYMIEWMKSYNAKSSNRQLSFYGCDISIDDQRRKGDVSASERDKAMANNCIRFLKSKKDSKLVLWAHNTHIANLDIPNFKTTGAYLKDILGEQYINFGILFGEGSFNARRADFKKQQTGEIETFTFGKQKDDSYASFFEQTGQSLSITDLRPIRSSPLFESWQDYMYTVREVGSSFDPSEEDNFSQKIDLANKYDGTIWIKEVTPSTVLEIAP